MIGESICCLDTAKHINNMSVSCKTSTALHLCSHKGTGPCNKSHGLTSFQVCRLFSTSVKDLAPGMNRHFKYMTVYIYQNPAHISLDLHLLLPTSYFNYIKHFILLIPSIVQKCGNQSSFIHSHYNMKITIINYYFVPN